MTVARLLSTTLRNSSGSTLNAHSYAYDLASHRTWLTNTAGDCRNYLYDNTGQLQGAHANESERRQGRTFEDSEPPCWSADGSHRWTR